MLNSSFILAETHPIVRQAYATLGHWNPKFVEQLQTEIYEL